MLSRSLSKSPAIGNSQSILESLWIWLLGASAAALLHLIYRTIRWTSGGAMSADELFSYPAPQIYVAWHRRQLMLPSIFRSLARQSKRKVAVLVSTHRDGRIAGAFAQQLGFTVVYGTSECDGEKALLRLHEYLKKGYDIFITPDGPLGPVGFPKPGILKLAQITGARICPISYSVKRAWFARSWDRLIIPKPFTHGSYAFGSALQIHSGLDPIKRHFNLKELARSLNDTDRCAERSLFRACQLST